MFVIFSEKRNRVYIFLTQHFPLSNLLMFFSGHESYYFYRLESSIYMDNCIILITGGKSLIAALATKHKLTGKQVTEIININFILLHFQDYYFFQVFLMAFWLLPFGSAFVSSLNALSKKYLSSNKSKELLIIYVQNVNRAKVSSRSKPSLRR